MEAGEEPVEVATPVRVQSGLEVWFHSLVGAAEGRARVAAVAVGILALVGIGGFVWGSRAAAPAPLRLPRVTQAAVARAPEPPSIHVHVAGEVLAPGLYRVAAGARVADLVDAAGGPTPIGDLDRLNLASLVRDGDRVEIPAVGSPGSAVIDDGLVDLNQAGVAELQALPGIGPALAGAIAEFRTAHGAFDSVDDLTEVPGIGPATLGRLRDLVKV